jgi:hypothetical protein
MKKIPIIVQMAVVVATIFLLDFMLASEKDGSLLVGLLFWAGVGQGLIAMTAAADLSRGKWIAGIKSYLQEYYPLLVMFPVAFLVFSRHITAYGWAEEHYSGWLSPSSFILRNVLALLLPFITAHIYVQSSQKNSEKTGLWAVLYLTAFVVSQSFLAFDVVMTFEYPWINTLFGGFFFVEALYAGIGFSAILAGLMMLKHAEPFKKAFRDFTLMIMGFALFWAGLFYSQYLVIWYGNIPEEVSYVYKRMEVPILNYMGIYIIFTLFLIPFLALVSRKIKSTVPAVSFIAILVFSGLVVERLIYLIPVANLSVPAVLLPLLLLGAPYIYLMITQSRTVVAE